MSEEVMHLDAFDERGIMEVEYEKFLTFYVDSQLYIIPSNQVIEIISFQQVAYMPNVPEFVTGVINLRGKVVPVIELEYRLKEKVSEYTDQTCIVIVELQGYSVGLIVERVDDVSDVDMAKIGSAPKMKKQEAGHDYITGIYKTNDKVAMVLDLNKVLGNVEMPQEI